MSTKKYDYFLNQVISGMEEALKPYPPTRTDSPKESPESVDSPPKPVRLQVVNEGGSLIVGDRQNDYGTPQENFQRIADYWNIHLASQLSSPISPRQVAELMALLKLARTIKSPKRDSYVDIIGYAGIAAELAEDA